MSHLKTLFTPSTWHVDRKHKKYIVKPLPSGNSLDLILPVRVAVRDMLHIVDTEREMRKILNSIQVNGKAQANTDSAIGIFDVLSTGKDHYRLMLDLNGRLNLMVINEKESKMKLSKVTGKQMINGGKIQVALNDGRTMIYDNTISVGDTVALELPEAKVTKVLKLKEGSFIFTIRGKNKGHYGTVKEIKDGKVAYEDKEGNKVETLKDYVVVIGEEKPLIALKNE